MITAMHHLTLDLSRPPAQRWNCLAALVPQVHALIGTFAGDLSAAAVDPLVRTIAWEVTPEPYRNEAEAIGRQCGIDPTLLMLGTAAYDLLKFRLGCTAIGCDAVGGPLHARNLDWWHSEVLARETAVIEVRNAPAGPFTMVGWPGFLGALSACAPGRFSLTLNAVSSIDPGIPTMPVALVIRQVLETARSFAEAVEQLSTRQLTCDALLMLAGCQPGELVVIERTPTRHALRRGVDGVVLATNDYRALSPQAGRSLDPALGGSADSRYACAWRRLSTEQPASPVRLRAILSDAQVAMSITAQRMVFQPATGLVEVEAIRQPWA